jgi:hypothetical protein
MVRWRVRPRFSTGALAFAISCLVLVLLFEGLTSATQPVISLIEKWSVNGTNGVLVHFDTDANRTYLLESTDKLGTNAAWQVLFSNRWSVPGHFIIPDLRPGNHFYRLHVTP